MENMVLVEYMYTPLPKKSLPLLGYLVSKFYSTSNFPFHQSISKKSRDAWEGLIPKVVAQRYKTIKR